MDTLNKIIKTPEDFLFLKQRLLTQELMGCDASFGNIFLYQKKYNSTLEIKDDVFFRYIKKPDGSVCFYFPLPLNTAPDNYLKGALEHIFTDFENPYFQYVSEKQKVQVELCLKQFFPYKQFVWTAERNDADYVYLQKDLAELSGVILQKKRNHINKFIKTYGDTWTFKRFPENPLFEEIMEVENCWLKERGGAENPDLAAECAIIQKALENADFLKLSGGVLFVNETPVAMTLASEISPSVLDIHFEKAIGEYAKNGAYAVINNQFAKACPEYKYFNREEDLGIEGLRKAKLSYKPEIIMEKYSGKVQ